MTDRRLLYTADVMKTLLAVVVVIVVSACGESGSPTAPSAPSTPAPTPTPVVYSLSGTVTSAAGGAIVGAAVAIGDGPNAGRSTTTAGDRRYKSTGLAVAVATP